MRQPQSFSWYNVDHHSNISSIGLTLHLHLQACPAVLLMINACCQQCKSLLVYTLHFSANLPGSDFDACTLPLLQVIARVGALSRLNGSSISRPERKDAELQYLRTLTGGSTLQAEP